MDRVDSVVINLVGIETTIERVVGTSGFPRVGLKRDYTNTRLGAELPVSRRRAKLEWIRAELVDVVAARIGGPNDQLELLDGGRVICRVVLSPVP